MATHLLSTNLERNIRYLQQRFSVVYHARYSSKLSQNVRNNDSEVEIFLRPVVSPDIIELRDCSRNRKCRKDIYEIRDLISTKQKSLIPNRLKEAQQSLLKFSAKEGNRGQDHHKLYEMKEYLAGHLTTFFTKTHNYSIYHTDMVFENNYYQPPQVYNGINAYVIQLNKYRWLASLRYARATFDILKITASEADNSVRVRWRVSGVTSMTAFKFWKFLPGRYRSTLDNESDWHDGYSTFYLNQDGAIVKHKVDKVIPDDELAVEKDPNLAPI